MDSREKGKEWKTQSKVGRERRNEGWIAIGMFRERNKETRRREKVSEMSSKGNIWKRKRRKMGKREVIRKGKKGQEI